MNSQNDLVESFLFYFNYLKLYTEISWGKKKIETITAQNRLSVKKKKGRKPQN